jgi:parallel beta-helix repeat protein
MANRVRLVLLLALAIGASPTAAADDPPPAKLTVIDAKSLGPRASHCYVFDNLKNAVIENLTVGPCPDIGIRLDGARNVTIRNVTITNTGGSGIYILGSQDVDIQESTISNTVSGVSVVDSASIHVDCNTISDVRGPIPAGQFVQFNTVTGPGNRISCNVGQNNPARQPEDAISLYKSQGTQYSPIEVYNNLIVGGGPSRSGGGIMLGDDGGMYQTARDKILVDPGQYGVAVSSGQHMSILRNQVFARRRAWTNVGISVWNQYPHVCGDISVAGNRVNWTNSANQANPFWDGENCGAIQGLADNTFPDPSINARIENHAASDCYCASAGRQKPGGAASTPR